MRSYEELKSASLGWTVEEGEPDWILELEGDSNNPPLWLNLFKSPLESWETDELSTLAVGLGVESLHIHARFACASESGPYRMGVLVEKRNPERPADVVLTARLIVDTVVAPHWHDTPEASPSTWYRAVEAWLGALPSSLTDGLEVRDWTAEQFAEAHAKRWFGPGTEEAVWVGFREPPCRWVFS